jgi:hypothetical protein
MNRERRNCKYFPLGKCSFGDRCKFVHYLGNVDPSFSVPLMTEHITRRSGDGKIVRSKQTYIKVVAITTRHRDGCVYLFTKDFVTFTERDHLGGQCGGHHLNYYNSNYKSLGDAILRQRTKFRSFALLSLFINELINVMDLVHIIIYKMVQFMAPETIYIEDYKTGKQSDISMLLGSKKQEQSSHNIAREHSSFCKYFPLGRCPFGANCLFEHCQPQSSTTTKISSVNEHSL